MEIDGIVLGFEFVLGASLAIAGMVAVASIALGAMSAVSWIINRKAPRSR